MFVISLMIHQHDSTHELTKQFGLATARRCTECFENKINANHDTNIRRTNLEDKVRSASVQRRGRETRPIALHASPLTGLNGLGVGATLSSSNGSGGGGNVLGGSKSGAQNESFLYS